MRPRGGNAGKTRLDRIVGILSECKYGIHDLSRTELDKVHRLPRFNMPLELGLDLGASRFGPDVMREKRLLIMDKSPYRYQKFISDIAGQDIVAHNGNTKQITRRVRDWLSIESKGPTIPGGSYLHTQYRVFRDDFPRLCKRQKLHIKQLTFGDFSDVVQLWLEEKES